MNEDARDEGIAEALAVPPLDDVTRRRLVRNALDAVDDQPASPDVAPERRSWAPLVAAAAVVLLVVVGLVALGRGGDDSSSDTAARKPDRLPTAETPTGQAPTAADSSNGAAASLASGVTDFGDLGDLSSDAARERARTTVAGNPSADTAPNAAGAQSEQLLQDVADAACADPLRTDGTTIVGVGRATVDGHRSVVVVTETAGVRTASLLVIRPCALSPL